MKRSALALVLAIAAAVTGFSVYYRAATSPVQAILKREGGELEWLRREFHLNDTQFAAVRQLHESYKVTCREMCQRISETNTRADQLIAVSRVVTPALETALEDCADAQDKCHRAMLGHVYAVAAQMSPEDGARFVAMMKGRLLIPGQTQQKVIARAREL